MDQYNVITTFKHGERRVLQLAADRFVLVEGYYRNVILLCRKNNGTPEYKKSFTEELQNKYFTAAYVLLLN